jgi:hypothetical protein
MMLRLPSRPKDRAVETGGGKGAFPGGLCWGVGTTEFPTTSSLADMTAATAFLHHRHRALLVHLNLR